MSKSEVNEVEFCFLSKENKEDVFCPFDDSEHAPYAPLLVESFSSIKRKLAKSAPQQEKVEKALEGLPEGKETGLILHRLIAEYLPDAKECGDTGEWVKKKIDGTILEKNGEEVAGLLGKLLDLPLKGFRLRDVDVKRAFYEMDFSFYENDTTLVHGTIDLCAEYENRAYLIDWKTHALCDYEQATLTKEIKAGSYDLQAKIYAKAFKRYLAQHSKPLAFGGIFFVFLRGIDENGKGVVLIDDDEHI